MVRFEALDVDFSKSLPLPCLQEQSELENFEVFLENEEGKTLGKVAVNHNTPTAKHQSVACVRDVFMLDHLGLDRVNETLAYKHLVEWFLGF